MSESRPSWTRHGLAWAAVLLILAPVVPIIAELAGWPWLVLLLGGAWVLRSALVRRLPPAVDLLPRRRPVLTVGWILLWLVASLWLVRLGLFHADPSRTWASTIPDAEVAGHACLSAYVRAAELVGRAVDNPYDASHWPALDVAANRESGVRGLAEWLEDPYQYPPTFLLVFRALLAFTQDFLVLRATYFLLQFLALVAIFAAVAQWVGVEARRAFWLLPAFLASLPTAFDLQFGQIHLLAIAAALWGRVLLEKGNRISGSIFLAAAILTKLFPAILLVELAARRRFRDLASVAGVALAGILLGIGVLGLAPHVAFVEYQLPRLLDGSAFSFFEKNALFVSRNFSVYGIPIKFQHLGWLADGHTAARWFSRLFALGLVWLAWRRGRSTTPGSRLDLTLDSLALLSLGALVSPLAPSAYILASPLWLLALLAAHVQGPTQTTLFVLAWLAITGPPPLPLPQPEFLVNLLLQIFVIALPLAGLWRGWSTSARYSQQVAGI